MTSCFGSRLAAVLALATAAGCVDAKAPATRPTPVADALPGGVAHVWVNDGGDKVCQEELRASFGQGMTNSVWDGKRVSLFGARNETLSFNVVLEARASEAKDVAVEVSPLRGPEDFVIGSREASGDGLFDYRGRDVELFFVRYLPVRGVTVLAYNHYDERHVPERFRRPHDARGKAWGVWEDRPDHDRSYPDIAAPLELHTPFSIHAGASQSIWVDVYVPSAAPPGDYRGELAVSEGGKQVFTAPIALRVEPFALPELPAAKTMLYVSQSDIHQRYLGQRYPHDSQDAALRQRAKRLVDRHFQMAHRHRVSVIHEHESIDRCKALWIDRLDGALFTPERGYAGTGVGVGNNVFCVGTYGHWPWREGTRDDMWRNTDEWVAWLDSLKLSTPTEALLYLIDESDNYEAIERWSEWARENPGPGKRLLAMATLPATKAAQHTPSLGVAASTVVFGDEEQWAPAVDKFRDAPDKRFYLYNGGRPGSGTFVLEDEGVALRNLGWCHFKAAADRWFCWQGTYYNNFQGDRGETNVFRSAHTFGSLGERDPARGETGWNYTNGDGVLFYPGTDTVYPDESYGLEGPIASLRLKLWRRGLQDYEYLTLAHEVDADATQRVVERMIPRVLWEVGITDPNDPTYVVSDISWSTDPDEWESARRELATIIARGPAAKRGAD
ncbi:MAG: hypothetical protein ACRCT8_16075 [Lacipirellulaceae bacterium]